VQMCTAENRNPRGWVEKGEIARPPTGKKRSEEERRRNTASKKPMTTGGRLQKIVPGRQTRCATSCGRRRTASHVVGLGARICRSANAVHRQKVLACACIGGPPAHKLTCGCEAGQLQDTISQQRDENCVGRQGGPLRHNPRYVITTKSTTKPKEAFAIAMQVVRTHAAPDGTFPVRLVQYLKKFQTRSSLQAAALAPCGAASTRATAFTAGGTQAQRPQLVGHANHPIPGGETPN